MNDLMRNPTVGYFCPTCRDETEVLVKDETGTVGSFCPTCDTVSPMAERATTVIQERSGWDAKRFEIMLRRNYWVMEMSRVPREETIIDDPFGPGKNRYTRCSYEIAVCDNELYQGGWMF